MLVRILNTFFLAAAGLSCLALYHVSEHTRVERVKLASVERQIVDERSTLSVLQAEWQRVANPERIQHLAETRLGMDDTPTVELSSFEMLPRRGEESPLNADPVQNASLVAPSRDTANLHVVVARGN
jgi:cell division protein FtsL